jgi:hypothetical protein
MALRRWEFRWEPNLLADARPALPAAETSSGATSWAPISRLAVTAAARKAGAGFASCSAFAAHTTTVRALLDKATDCILVASTERRRCAMLSEVLLRLVKQVQQPTNCTAVA